jgi:hypothetical protein
MLKGLKGNRPEAAYRPSPAPAAPQTKGGVLNRAAEWLGHLPDDKFYGIVQQGNLNVEVPLSDLPGYASQGKQVWLMKDDGQRSSGWVPKRQTQADTVAMSFRAVAFDHPAGQPFPVASLDDLQRFERAVKRVVDGH